VSKKRNVKEETTEVVTVTEEVVLVVEEPAPAPVIQTLPIVGLDVYATTAGIKWDQLAGFIAYAKAQKLAPRTIPDWRLALVAFNNRPVG
jgi:hypothetical protein